MITLRSALPKIVLAAAMLLPLGAAPAVAAGGFGPAATMLSCSNTAEFRSPDGFGLDYGQALRTAAGSIVGFTYCLTRSGNLPEQRAAITYYEAGSTGVVRRELLAPYLGSIVDMAWDATSSLYLLYASGTANEPGSTLYIGKYDTRVRQFAPPTKLTATLGPSGSLPGSVVASAGKWWAVWPERDGHLYQRHTLMSAVGRQRVTGVAGNDAPALAYATGHVTLVWSRGVNLLVSTNSGSSWTSPATLASNIAFNYARPEIQIQSGVTHVLWQGNLSGCTGPCWGTAYYADNATGHYQTTHLVDLDSQGENQMYMTLGNGQVWVARDADANGLIADRMRVVALSGSTTSLVYDGPGWTPSVDTWNRSPVSLLYISGHAGLVSMSFDGSTSASRLAVQWQS